MSIKLMSIILVVINSPNESAPKPPPKLKTDFLGYSLTDYPGTNSHYIQINREKWEEYYRCLWNLNQSLSHNTLPPESLITFEGASLTLPCKICLSPLEKTTSDLIKWYFASPGSKLKLVEYNEHFLLSPREKSLSLYNLNKHQTGQYLCKLGNSLTSPYFLTVLELQFNETFKKVYPLSSTQKPHPKPSEQLTKLNLKLNTVYSNWSSCSHCGQVGKRYRFGFCCLSILDSSKGLVSENITKKDWEILEIFEKGLPCSSHILPESFKKVKKVELREDELMEGLCKVSCDDEKVFVVKNKKGEVIEKADNSKGIYSAAQGIPTEKPEVERRLVYGERGKRIELKCPGNLHSDAPIEWKIGEIKATSKNLKKTNGRIYISITDKIHILKLHQSDSNIYSCWQKDELAGIVRLIVEKRQKMTFNHHLMLLAIVIILSTFLIVFMRALTGRKYAIVQ